MRVIFTTNSGLGHFHPLVPLGQALQRAGHEVTFAVNPAFCPVVERCGFGSLSVGEDYYSSEIGQKQTELELAGQMDGALEVVLELFIGKATRARAQDLVAKLSRNPPDLMIREGQECAGFAAAEKLGVAHAAVQVGPGDGPLATHPDFIARIAALEESVGLTPAPKLGRMYRYLNVANAPKSFFEELPPTTRYFKAPIFDASDPEPSPAWLERLGERPVVFIGLGTSYFQAGMMSEIIEGLRNEPLDLVVTTGKDYDPSILGPPAPNIHVAGYLRHSLILPKCAAAVLHGGYGSVLSAIHASVPMVLVPFFADQPMNAERARANGAAQLLKPQGITGAQVLAAVREALNDPRYRDNARRLAQEWSAQPEIAQAVPLLERIVKERRPVTELA